MWQENQIERGNPESKCRVRKKGAERKIQVPRRSVSDQRGDYKLKKGFWLKGVLGVKIP